MRLPSYEPMPWVSVFGRDAPMHCPHTFTFSSFILSLEMSSDERVRISTVGSAKHTFCMFDVVSS